MGGCKLIDTCVLQRCLVGNKVQCARCSTSGLKAAELDRRARRGTWLQCHCHNFISSSELAHGTVQLV